MSNQVAQIKSESKSGFALQPQNINEAMQMATMISNSSLAPQNYKNKPDDTLVAMMMGNELGLNPMQALQNIAVINGKPAIYGDAMIALVQNHPSFEAIKETFDDATMTAICQVKRKGGEWETRTFSQADAQSAGLWTRKGVWQQYPKRMLQMRARGFALRDQFADALLGLISVEEAQDYPTERNTTGHVKVEQDSAPDYSEEIAEIQANVNNLNSIQELVDYLEIIDPALVAKVKPMFTARKKELQNA